MKAKDLIQQLQTLNPETEVLIYSEQFQAFTKCDGVEALNVALENEDGGIATYQRTDGPTAIKAVYLLDEGE